jgi:hypothetical protein
MLSKVLGDSKDLDVLFSTAFKSEFGGVGPEILIECDEFARDLELFVFDSWFLSSPVEASGIVRELPFSIRFLIPSSKNESFEVTAESTLANWSSDNDNCVAPCL